MKNTVLIVFLLIGTNSWSTNLIDVFQQALANEPTYQNEVLKTLASEADIGIVSAILFPQIDFKSELLTDKQTNSGTIVSNGLQPQNNSLHSVDNRLSLNQTVFNAENFARLSATKMSYQVAGANLNAQFQDLIVRVAEAYFNTLYYKNKLYYYQSNKNTMLKQLSQVKEKYRVGKASRNDWDIAASALSQSESDYLNAQMQLSEQFLHLAELCNIEYTNLADLQDNFPIKAPKSNLEDWVDTALRQNWTIKKNQLRVKAAREKIKQHYAGHYPRANIELYYDAQPFYFKNGSLLVSPGASRQNNLVAAFNINMPIYSGGLVTAQVKKHQYLFQIVEQQLDASFRQTKYSVKKSYNRLFSYIKKIKSDRQIIRSNQSVLHNFKERYAAGTTDLMHVINQQDKLIHLQTRYSQDKFNYIIEMLKLKKATGTLSIEDVRMINNWLKN